MTAFAASDRQAFKAFRLREQALDPDHDLGVGGFDRSAGHLDILRPQGAVDIRYGNAPGRHGLGVEPDADGIAPLAADADAGNAVDNAEPVHHGAFGIVGQFFRRHAVGYQGVPHEGTGIGVLLLDFDILDLRRQTVGNPRNGIADIIGGGLDVPAQIEGDRYAGISIARGRLDQINAVDSRELVLDDLGDAVFNHFRVRSGIFHGDRNHRLVNIRKFAQRKLAEAQYAENDDEGAGNKRQYGASDRNIR